MVVEGIPLDEISPVTFRTGDQLSVNRIMALLVVPPVGLFPEPTGTTGEWTDERKRLIPFFTVVPATLGTSPGFLWL